MALYTQDRKSDIGLLLMRLGLSAMLLLHAAPQLVKGANAWKSVGMSLNFVNPAIPSHYFGGLVLLVEALGSICMIFGYLSRTASLLLCALFGAYCFNYYSIGYSTLMLWSLGLSLVFFGLLYTGPGRYAVAVKLEKH